MRFSVWKQKTKRGRLSWGYVSVLLCVAPLMFGACSDLQNWVTTYRPDDCEQQAPTDCDRATVESAAKQNWGFSGYVFCACVTKDGRAIGYVAAKSDVYPVKDGRRERVETLGNDNPAASFPAGAPR